MTSLLLRATALDIPLADRSVQCVVTSPPYWGLRDYKLPSTVWPSSVIPAQAGIHPCNHEALGHLAT